MLSDDFFAPGDLKFLVVGNECRLLDKRRTPGVIKSIDSKGGFFRWEMTDFEDKGNFWDVELERVNTYQFKQDSNVLIPDEIEYLRNRIAALSKHVEIKASKSETLLTNQNLNLCINEIDKWLKHNSMFFRSNQSIDFQSLNGPQLLREDFNRFMSEVGMSDVEVRTAETQVLNPHSGDWIRAMQIVMAEMGLKDFIGRDIRSPDTFRGIGARANRRKYIEYRLGFLRSIFGKLGYREVELYRGMSTEWDWQTNDPKQNRFWSSWTFNYKVGQDFSELKPNTKQKNSYLIKRAIPIDRLFMTFIETDAMNRQYLEAEALVLHGEDDRILW